MEHVQTLDPENPRDIIDQYLLEKEKDKNHKSYAQRDACKLYASACSIIYTHSYNN